MQCDLKNRRRELGVSLDQVAAALGPGFSRARLSIAERGLIELSVSEQRIILEAVERLGQIRRVVDMAESLDLAGICADLRQQSAAVA